VGARGQQPERGQRVERPRRQQRLDLIARGVVAIDEELGQELQAILDRCWARWTRLQAGQGVDTVAREERLLGVGDVL